MFKGVYAALLTPFDRGGEVMEDVLREHVRFLLDRGLQGLYVCGNSGQCFYLSVAERQRILEIVLAEVAGRIPIIAHIAALATRDACRLAAHAADAGANAVASLPPVYSIHTDDEVLAYYRTVAAASPLPCFIYHLAGRGSAALSLPTLLRLAEVPQIVGIKYTAPDFFTLQDLLMHTSPRWIAFSGPDELFLPALTMGVDGSIGTTQNVVPEVFTTILEAFQAGDLKRAMALQETVTRIVSLYREYGGLAVCRTLLQVRGVSRTWSRAPINPALTPENEAAVIAAAAAIFAACPIKLDTRG